MYWLRTRVTSSITRSLFSILTCTSPASFFNVSNVPITLLSSRMLPQTLLRADNRLSSNSLSFTWNSPQSFNRSTLCSSMSGLSCFRQMLRHWFYSEAGVTVKLTKVTLEHRSGVNLAEESLVIMNIKKLSAKSISQSPTLISTLPPVLCNSLFKTLLRIGSIFSTSWTKRGHPNLRAVSRFFMKESSAKLVLLIFLSLQKERTYSRACPLGSMIKGYLWNLERIIAFSVHRSSEGSLCDCQVNLSLGLLRYQMMLMSSLQEMLSFSIIVFQCLSNILLQKWSKKPRQARKAPARRESPGVAAICYWNCCWLFYHLSFSL